MCDARTESLVRSTVDGFVSKGYMFTAFDVTRFLRKSGEQVAHHDVNGVVKSMFANSEMGSGSDQYQRDTKDVGAKVPPFIYYHPYSDVDNYDQDWINSNPTQNGMKNDPVASLPSFSTPATPVTPVTPVPVTSTMTITGMTVKNLPANVRAVTKEGRLEIPLTVMLKTGFASNDEAYVRKLNDKLVIENSKSVGYGIGLPVAVNKDGRIRLSRGALNGISSGNLFKVETTGTNDEVIEVSPYVATV
jgi:hypothetical protein